MGVMHPKNVGDNENNGGTNNLDACREILLNAVVHKAYESCNPIQISIYEDHMYIWNEGRMPEELDSTEKLFEKHSSKPYNPKLANTFFKSGMIEAWFCAMPVICICS